MVAARSVKKWQPALVGQEYRERDLKAVLATDLAAPTANDTYGYREGSTGALGFHMHLAEESGM